MANLVSPGFNRSSLINQILAPTEERIIEFKGLNRKNSVEEGEMSDMQNLTSDNYPLLCPRKLRGQMTLPDNVAKPLKIITKFERIAMIAKKTDNNIAFFYGTPDNLSEVSSVTNLSEFTEMVAINTKICFFTGPYKKYVSLKRSSDDVEIVETGNLDDMIEMDVGSYFIITLTNNKYTIGPIPGSHSFKADDAIDIKGTLKYKASGSSTFTTKECVVSCIIESVSTSGGSTQLTLPRETFIEMTGEGATEITLESVDSDHLASIRREMPDLIHVVEWNNRLWGASNDDNTIYACKLGDPTNWKYFQGTSLDSYYAQQGTDENWTGSAAYSGHLIFFKPNSMTKIYGTSPSTFQVNNTVCYGVEPGSNRSVSIINDIVFYKSSIGIMAYEGGVPYLISEKLNAEFSDVVGGTEGRKYYASILKADNTHELLVFDTDRGIWHREDEVRFHDCCTLDGSLYFISGSDAGLFAEDNVYIINPKNATERKIDREWSAVFGPFDEYLENQKIYSKISLRFVAQPRTRIRIYIKMDNGSWEKIKEFSYVETGGETVMIVPRRCDRFSIKIAGIGDCEIKSLNRRCRMGSGVKP